MSERVNPGAGEQAGRPDTQQDEDTGRLLTGAEVTGPWVKPAQLQAVPRIGRVWRDRAHWVVRGVGAPTVTIGAPGGDEVSQRHARSVIDLALRVGEAMLSTGASASDVVATLLRLTHAYGVHSAHIDITFTSVSVSIHRGVDEDPLSVMRVVKVRSADYTRLEALQTLVDQVADPAHPYGYGLDIDAARARLERILTAPHPYRRWVVTAGVSLLATGVVGLFGAQPGMMLVAAIAVAVVDRAQRRLAQFGVAAFFNQAVAAAIPTSVAVALNYLEDRGIEVPGVESPSLVVIAGIILLLAGLTVMGAAHDALEGYYVTAGARGLEVLMLTAGIAAGISAVLGLAFRLGIPMQVSPYVGVGDDLVLTTISAMLVAAGFCISTYTGVRTTMVALAVSALAWLVFQAVLLLQVGTPTATFFASTAVGAAAYVGHRSWRLPELPVATAGIVSLLPGLAVYRFLFLMMEDSAGLVGTAMVELTRALATGLALAAGVSIGGFLVRRRFGLDLASTRARRRARGGYV
ncbi:threonine/serine exporter family protein [Ornithinicoccus halotolerans]|uniref:threonine/serine ThrE exporter family protein n=1 Tax=Ornithinicoccus halotolerans TaxID=1748220 RepID=UPI001297D11C|nr:threonine/serine exporter family protein [Ornithinicoccus halotolerans]